LNEMPKYVDGFVVPVPKKKLADYILEQGTLTEIDDPAGAFLADIMAYYIRMHCPELKDAAGIKQHCKHLQPFWGALMMKDILGPKCREYIEARTAVEFKGKKIKPVTANKELGTLGAACRFWGKEKGVAMIPRVTRSKKGKSRPRERVPERDEFARLLWEARRLGYKEIVRFLLIGCYTGTRKDCLMKLRWVPSIDTGNVNTKRGILYRLGSDEIESNKRKPPCELEPKLLAFCRRWETADRKAGIANIISGKVRGDWDGTRARPPWSRVIEAAGLASDKVIGGKLQRGSDVTPHTLRHTCVTWALWEGKGIMKAAEIAGMDPEMVMRVYGHHEAASREYQRQKAERLARAAARRAA